MNYGIIKKRENLKNIFSKIFRIGGVYLVLFFFIALSGILSPRLLEPSHVMNILKNVAVLGIISIAQTLLILTRGIDLSVGAHVVFIMLLVDGISMGNPNKTFLVIVVSLIVGIFIGLLNGILVVKFKIEPLVGSLGVMSLITGISYIYTKGYGRGGPPPFIRSVGSGDIFNFLPISVIIWAIISVIVVIMLKKTIFGRYIYATGSNPKSAAIAGINTPVVSLAVYIISGFLVAIAGIVWAGYLSYPSLAGGESFPLDSIAAVVIGGTTFAGGKGGIGGTIIGTIILGILASLLNMIGLGHFWKLILEGVLILLLVFSYSGRSKAN